MPRQVAHRLHAAGTFRKNDCQRLIDGALAEFPRCHEAGKAEHVIGMTVGDGEHRRRKDVRAKGQLRAFAGVHEELQRPMPEPVGEHSPAETAHHVLHLTHSGASICQLL